LNRFTFQNLQKLKESVRDKMAHFTTMQTLRGRDAGA